MFDNAHVDFNSLILLLVAVATAFNTYYSRRTEKNTNSMKDALVETTRQISRAEGVTEGKQQEKDRRGEANGT